MSCRSGYKLPSGTALLPRINQGCSSRTGCSSQLAVPPPGWLALGLGEDGRGHVGRLPSGQELGEYVDEVLRLKRASDHLSKQWDVVVLDDVKTLC